MTGPWAMHGGFYENGDCGHVGDERTVRMYDFEPVPVVLTEDPDGDYRGWIETDGDGVPVMVLHHKVYLIQFAYGPEVEEKRGRGRTVRLRIERTAA